MPWTAVYFLNRSTLASFSCSSPVSTAPGPSRSVIALTIDGRSSGDRDGAMDGSAPSRFSRFWTGSADQVPAVDDQDVAVDVVGGPAGQEDGGPHQVGDLPPAARRDVLDDTAVGGRIRPGRLGDRGLEVPRSDGVDLDVVGRQLVAEIGR